MKRPSDQAVLARTGQRAAELKAARESGLLVRSEHSSSAAGSAEAVMSSPPSPPAAGTAAMPDPEHDPNAQQRKLTFVATLDKDGDLTPHALRPPLSRIHPLRAALSSG